MNLSYSQSIKLTTFLLLLLVVIPNVHAKFIDDFGHLKKFIDRPAESNYYVGFGVSPFGLIGEKSYAAISLFQLHYISERLDFNIVSADLGVISSSNDFANAKNFTLKSVPKFVLAELFSNTILSFGPLVGIEFIKFDNVKTQLRKGNSVTVSDNLSASATIFGAVFEETVDFKSYKVKITQAAYRQNYSITDANDGWYHFYEDPEAEEDKNQEIMKANDVFSLSISVIF